MRGGRAGRVVIRVSHNSINHNSINHNNINHNSINYNNRASSWLLMAMRS